MPRSLARSLKRHPPKLTPRPSILIVCEGEKTEYHYFRDFRSKEHARLLEIDIVHSDSDPLSVVNFALQRKTEADERAVRMHDDNERIDEIWCVVDVDDHAGLDRAIQAASNDGIKLAISNPCFELWVLLHFREQNALLRAKAAKSACRKDIPGYDGQVPFERLWEKYQLAVHRATNLDKKHQGKPKPGNPCTRVYLLTERLRELGRSQALRKQLQITGRR
jgi:hypothetical protein